MELIQQTHFCFVIWALVLDKINRSRSKKTKFSCFQVFISQPLIFKGTNNSSFGWLCSVSLHGFIPVNSQIFLRSTLSLDSAWHWVTSHDIRKGRWRNKGTIPSSSQWGWEFNLSFFLRTGSLYVTQGGWNPTWPPAMTSECHRYSHVPPHLLVINFEIPKCPWLSKTNYWSQTIITVINSCIMTILGCLLDYLQNWQKAKHRGTPVRYFYLIKSLLEGRRTAPSPPAMLKSRLFEVGRPTLNLGHPCFCKSLCKWHWMKKLLLFACFSLFLLASLSILLQRHTFTGIRAYFFRLSVYTEDTLKHPALGDEHCWIFELSVGRQPLLNYLGYRL